MFHQQYQLGLIKMPEQSVVPFGNLNLDGDIARIKEGDYSNALDIAFITDEGGSSVSAENQYGNKFSFKLGSVVPQVKKFVTTFDFYTTIPETKTVVVFRSNGLKWFEFTYQNDTTPALTAANFQTAFLTNIGIPAFPFNISPISAGSATYVYFFSQVGLDWDISIENVQQTIIQEPVARAGIFKPIGSSYIDNDLFVWSCITDDEPLKVDVVNSQQAGQMVAVNTAPYTDPFIGLQNVYITGTNNGMDGAWLAQNSAGSPFSFLLIGSQWTANSNGGTILIGTEAIGELGVAQYTEGTDSYAYTRLIRSRKFNFISKKQIDCRPTERNIRSTNFYWTDNYNMQRCMYYKGAYVQDGFLTYFNPNGQYDYQSLAEEIKSQVVGLFKIEFVDQVESGGAVKAGNHRYVVRATNTQSNKTEISIPTGLINVFSSGFNSQALGDNVGDATSKINRLVVTDIKPGIFQKIELIDILYSSSIGLVSATVVNSYTLGADDVSIDVQHTGNETGSYALDPTELLYLTQVYKTVKSNQVIDNRMVNTNVTLFQDKDFREFAKTFQHEIIVGDAGSWGSFYTSSDINYFRSTPPPPPGIGFPFATDFKFGAYKQPQTVHNSMSLMLNETYRFKVVFKMKDSGQLSPAYWIDDICINADSDNNNPLGQPVTLPNRRIPSTDPFISPYRIQDMNITSSFIAQPDGGGYTFRVEFSRFDVGFLIDGKPVYEIVDEMYIFMDNCIPEILFNGILVPMVANAYTFPSGTPETYEAANGYLTDWFDATGGVPSGQSNSQTTNRYSTLPLSGTSYRQYPGQFAFYSPDHDMAGNNLDGYRNGDYILNYGAMYGFYPDGGIQNQLLPNAICYYNNSLTELYQLANGVTNGNINFKQVMPASNFNAGGYVNAGGSFNFSFATYTKNQKSSLTTPPTEDTYYNLADSWVFDPNAILDPLVTFAPRQDLFVDTICYAQYYRQIFNNPLNPEEGKYGKFDQGISYYAGASVNMTFARQYAGQPFPSSGTSGFTTFGVTFFATRYGDVFTQRYLHKIKTPTQTNISFPWGSTFESLVGGGGAISYFCQNRNNSNMINKVNSDGQPQYPIGTYTEWLGSYFRQRPRYDRTYSYHTGVKGIVGYNILVKDYTAPSRTVYSALKPQDGTYDGYRDFQPLDFLDVPMTDGEITHHEKVNGELFIQQVKKWLKYFFNTRGELQVTGNSTSIAIGDGSVLARPPIELSAYGSRNKWSFIKGKSVGGQEVVYIFDLTSKAIIRYAGDGTRNISIENNVDSFIRNNTRFLDGVDTPAWKYGITGVWNEKRKVAIWTARAINPTKPIWFVTLPYQVGDIVWFGDNNTDAGWEQLPAFFECIQANSGSLSNKPLSGADWQDYWIQLPLSDNRVYNVWTLEFNELKNGFSTFGTPKPKIYMPFRNTVLTGDPRVSLSNQYEQDIYEQDNGEKGVWYDYRTGEGLFADGFIELVFNSQAQDIKHYLALRVNSLIKPFKFELFTKKNKTFMLASDVEEREDLFFTAVKNDSNTPPYVGQNDQDTSAIFGQYVKIKMYFEKRTRQYLTDLMIRFKFSPRNSNK